MGKIIYDTGTTFNGFLADEGGSIDWLFAVPSDDSDDEQLMPSGMAVMVEGSTTYEGLLAASDILANPQKWSEFHGDRPVFVFTSRELPIPEGADVRLVNGPVADVLPEIRDVAGDGDIWVVGGGELAAQFLDAGALDEIALSVAPVALESGAPLFPRRVESDGLTLVSAMQVGQFARLVYATAVR
jgi:dihydrofolate reductase